MKESNNRQSRRRAADVKALAMSTHFLNEEDDGSFICLLKGPKDTPYSKMQWRVRVQLPHTYPFRSPSVGFVDKIFHPNVDIRSGTICLNALNHEWTPVYNLISIIEVLLPQLLTYPNPDDPLNAEAAQLLLKDNATFAQKCSEYRGMPESC